MTMALQKERYQEKSTNLLRRERLRIPNACQVCRLRKVKCDGRRPACTRCRGKGKTCTYSRDSGTIERQPKRKSPGEHVPPIRSHVPVLATPLASRAHSLEARPVIEPSCEQRHGEKNRDPEPEQHPGYPTAHGRFAGEVAAAIDARAGSAPVAAHLVPFVDAPLFGEVDLQSQRNVQDYAIDLPPRIYADRLVDIYWQHIHHVEPILDQERFCLDYEASYSRPGVFLNAESGVWLSTLNVVFALAVQRQETIPFQKRDEEGNRYFQRAWEFLRPETILWKPGSLETVQCLMLINRYLHCTNNQQKTWMTAGLAMRMAQSMCGHISELPVAKESYKDIQLKQRVLASCAALDRCVSWSLGRTSMPSLIPLPDRTGSVFSSNGDQDGSVHGVNITLGLELHEIGNQIQLAQTQTRNNLATRLGLPRLYQQDEYHGVAVQLDACLSKWENSLPSDWKLQNLPKVVNRTSRAERYLLHLRLLHHRIFLYRPMLARFYSVKLRIQPTEMASTTPSLSDRLLEECAGMCVEAAQKVTSLIMETLEPDEPIGLLPWWYRIYYLHIAGTNFLAAMVGSHLFTESASQSWRNVMSALRSHEHLSIYVQHSIQTFEALSARIMATRSPKLDGSVDVPLADGTSNVLFDDIFQNVDFDFDNFLFGADDIAQSQF